MDLNAIKSSLRIHEGKSLKPYQCTAGKLSIGYGRNLDDRGITNAEAEYLLDNDIETAVAELDRVFPGWRNHSDNVQNVLVELSFAMGAPRLSGFKKMWAALDARDYPTAAAELLDSRWRQQVGQRAITLADRLRNG